jgi:MoaA/NifB/PqqE/SkfB family radical SAM enzyme
MVDDITTIYLDFIPPDLRAIPWRVHPLDGELLLFDRDSGLNVLLDGEETAHLRRVAPRTLLIAVTNACDLTCPFCYRDLQARSLWRYDSLLRFCQEADQWGVLEVAFGGGEPMLFPRWADFINELYDTSQLCVNFTTNGTRLNGDFLRQIDGKYGNIRLSLYEDNNWADSIQLLVEHGTRFGVNWLITPAELPGLEAKFLHLLGMGVRDFLLIGYKGPDRSLHVRPEHYAILSETVQKLYTAAKSLAQIKLDVCWGDRLPEVPRLFQEEDCNAGDGYLSITSDQRVKACSFMDGGQPFETIDDLKRIWQQGRKHKPPAQIAGCARLPGRGLTANGSPNHAILDSTMSRDW